MAVRRISEGASIRQRTDSTDTEEKLMNLYHATLETHARYLIEDRIHPTYRVMPGALRRRHRDLLRRDKR